MTFSLEAAARGWLRDHKWRRLGKTVDVINDCRDLGAHLNATQRWRSTTLADRMRQTAKAAIGLSRIKAPSGNKQPSYVQKGNRRRCTDAICHR